MERLRQDEVDAESYFINPGSLHGAGFFAVKLFFLTHRPPANRHSISLRNAGNLI